MGEGCEIGMGICLLCTMGFEEVIRRVRRDVGSASKSRIDAGFVGTR